MAAVAKIAAERGYAALTAERVTRSAGVPRASFDAHFESKAQGLLAAQDAFLERLWKEVMAACEAAGEWPRKVKAAVGAVLAALAEASALARVFAVEAVAAGPALVERQHAALDRFAALLGEGRRYYPASRALPETTERLLVGGVASIVESCLLAEDPRAIDALEEELVEFVLLPYLGEDEARRVAVEG